MKRSKGSHPVSDVRGHNDETSIFGSRLWTSHMGGAACRKNVIFPLLYLFLDFILSDDSEEYQLWGFLDVKALFVSELLSHWNRC